MGRSMTTDGFNLKLFSEGGGTATFPAHPGGFAVIEKLVTIPHGYGSSELIFQAGAGGTIAPFRTYVGSTEVNCFIDDTNLYISVVRSQFGTGSAFDFDYHYRLLIP